VVTNGGAAGPSRDGQIAAAARRLREAESSRQPCPPIRTLFPELIDEVSAYQVQAENTRHALTNGRRLVGRKIGLTAKSVQQQLGVDTPDYGMLFADMIRADGEKIARGDVLQPKLEAEIALVLERDLAIEQPTIADVIRATAFVLPALEPALVALRARHPDKTMMLSLLCDAEVTARLERAGFLVFAEPSRAVRALAAATRLAAPPPSEPRHLPESLPQQHFPSRLTEHEAKAVLAEAGIAVAPERVAATAEEARQAARALGFPVAMKILSADVAHKSDIGAVLLDLKTTDDVAAGFDLILRRVRDAMPNAAIAGVLVSPMVRGVAETILGARRDPVFGPVVMFGLGGVFVEIFRDVTFRAAPFGLDEAHAMIREIAAFPLLDGARGRPKADLDALAEALVRLSLFAAANVDTVAEVDINPFVIGERGGVAVDALIVPVGHASRIDPAR